MSSFHFGTNLQLISTCNLDQYVHLQRPSNRHPCFKSSDMVICYVSLSCGLVVEFPNEVISIFIEIKRS